MVICSDTSFLYALYGNDCHSAIASQWIATVEKPIWISAFNQLEIRNALRFAEFSKRMTPGKSAAHLSLFENAIKLGRLIPSNCNLADVLAEANRISATYTLTGGHRSFDILHVAAAKIIQGTHFLTFDGNQRRLAEKTGLVVPF
jgi:predicted nucleic acid-binding protein